MNVIIATVRNCSIDNDYMKLKIVLVLKDKIFRVYYFNVRLYRFNLKKTFE